jgi:hypothetical protein
MLGAIDKGDADRCFAMDDPDEVAAEGLDRTSFGNLLKIFRRETAGATHGPPVIQGDLRNTFALIEYTKDGHYLATLALGSVAAQPGGTPHASQLAYDLLIAAVQAKGSTDPQASGSPRKAMLAGLQDMRGELSKDGPPKYYEGSPQAPPKTIDEIIEEFKVRLARMAKEGR